MDVVPPLVRIKRVCHIIQSERCTANSIGVTPDHRSKIRWFYEVLPRVTMPEHDVRAFSVTVRRRKPGDDRAVVRHTEFDRTRAQVKHINRHLVEPPGIPTAI